MSLSGIHKAVVHDLTPALRFEKGDGYLLRPLPDSIPFVIATHFLVGGTSSVDQSLYAIPISVDFVMGPTGVDNVSIQQLRFLGVRFVKHETRRLSLTLSTSIGRRRRHLATRDANVAERQSYDACSVKPSEVVQFIKVL